MDEYTHGWNELNQSLWDENSTEIETCVSTKNNHFYDLFNYLVECHLLSLHFLADEADIWLALQCAFECYMARTTTHQADEVPVFLSRVSIALDISNQLAIYLTSRVKTKGSLNHIILEVTINSLWTTNHLDTTLLLEIVLSQYARIGIAIITTNDYDSLDTQLIAYFNTVVKLPSFF